MIILFQQMIQGKGAKYNAKIHQINLVVFRTQLLVLSSSLVQQLQQKLLNGKMVILPIDPCWNYADYIHSTLVAKFTKADGASIVSANTVSNKQTIKRRSGFGGSVFLCKSSTLNKAAPVRVMNWCGFVLTIWLVAHNRESSGFWHRSAGMIRFARS